MKYFELPYTTTNIKKQYREHAKQLHPDTTDGDKEKFIELKKQYDFLLNRLANPRKKTTSKKNNTFVKVINVNLDLAAAEKLLKKYFR